MTKPMKSNANVSMWTKLGYIVLALIVGEIEYIIVYVLFRVELPVSWAAGVITMMAISPGFKKDVMGIKPKENAKQSTGVLLKQRSIRESKK